MKFPEHELCVHIDGGVARVVLCENAISLTLTGDPAKEDVEKGQVTLHLSAVDAGRIAGLVEVAAQVWEEAKKR